MFLYFSGHPVNTKYLYNICTMLDQRRRRWTSVVHMLYESFVFAGQICDPIWKKEVYVADINIGNFILTDPESTQNHF